RYLRRQYRYRRYWPAPPAVRAEADFLGHWAFPRPPAGGLFFCLSAKVSLAKKSTFLFAGDEISLQNVIQSQELVKAGRSFPWAGVRRQLLPKAATPVLASNRKPCPTCARYCARQCGCAGGRKRLRTWCRKPCFVRGKVLAGSKRIATAKPGCLPSS